MTNVVTIAVTPELDKEKFAALADEIYLITRNAVLAGVQDALNAISPSPRNINKASP